MRHKIEKGIPIPPRHKDMLPFPFLEVGESFTLPFKKNGKRFSLQQYNLRLHPKKFLLRSYKQHGFYRIWRIK